MTILVSTFNKGDNHPINHSNTNKLLNDKENRTLGFIKHGTKLISVLWNDCQIVKTIDDKNKLT